MVVDVDTSGSKTFFGIPGVVNDREAGPGREVVTDMLEVSLRSVLVSVSRVVGVIIRLA